MDPDHYDFRLIRPEDLFVAQLTLTNLVIDEPRRRLVRVTPAAEASVELELPTQHYAEPSSESWPGGLPIVVPLFAGPRSRLELIAPDGVDEFVFDDRGIMGAIAEWRRNPGGTWVDVLSTLWLQPPDRLRIVADPPGAGDRHPLWSARVPLADGESVALAAYPVAVPLPSGFYGQPGDGGPGPVLRPHTQPGYYPGWSLSALTMTSLGATAAIDGPDTGIDAFPAGGHTHRTSLGRTTYARQVVTGHVSSGHRATISVVAQRRFRRAAVADDAGIVSTAGPLDRTATLVITEPYVDLRAEGQGPSALAGLRAPTGEHRISGTDPTRPDWVRSGGGIPLFDFLADDHAGGTVPVRMPLVFIPDGADAAAALALLGAADAPAATMPTASMAVAPDPHAVVTVAGFRASSVRGASRPVIPLVDDLDVIVDQLGGVMDRPPTARFRFHDLYRASGMSPQANPQGAILQIVPPTPGTQLSIPLPPAAVGAVGNPGLVVGAITTHAGAVAQQLARSAAPSLADIKAAFPSAKLFGSIDLLALLPQQPFDSIDGRADIPAVRHRHIAEGEEFSYTFSAALAPQHTGTVIVREGARLDLSSTVVRRTDGSMTTESRGTVTGIGLTLADVVTLGFAQVAFRSRAGATTFDVSGVELAFGKELEFVAALASKLKELGTGSGVRVDVDAGGVTAGFGLAIPSVALAALQFSNLTVDAWLRVPFTSAPMAFTLAVASRERPFLVTVSMFGGGGWFALEVSPAGIRRLEVGIEFGGSLSLDIFVASGGVTVMAGIYIEWDAAKRSTTFRAYLRASGHLSVLGIVTVFVEFVLELGYRKAPLEPGGRPYAIFSGRASVTVGIEVLFFSKSVTLTVERSFVGSEADPAFTDCIEPRDWDAYCDAFLPTAAGGA